MPVWVHFSWLSSENCENNLYLQVSLEFVQSGGRGSPLVMGRAEKEGESVLGSTSEAVSDPPQPSGRSGAVEECGDEEQSSPIHLREKDINTRGEQTPETVISPLYSYLKYEIS